MAAENGTADVHHLVCAKLSSSAEHLTTSSFPDKLPDISSEEAPATAAVKLRLLLKHLEKGEVPVTIRDLRRTLSYAADVLTHSVINSQREGSLINTEILSSVKDTEIREWLSSTFTKRVQLSLSESRQKPLSFKNVATTLMIGKYIENKYKDRTQIKSLLYPPGLPEIFQMLDSWEFGIFEAELITSHQPLRYIGHEIFKRHNLLTAHKISPSILDAFLCQLERGYKAHNNIYHNETHGADVLQTVHALVCSAHLDEFWLSSLEILALLLAATIHDVDHPGTTNAFQVKTYSDYALCYNDRSVLENHHLHHAFQLLKEKEYNILENLSQDEFIAVRELIINMVLATDMSGHFEQLKQMRLLLSDSASQLSEKHHSKVLCLLIHTADISHPGKRWEVHSEWTSRITEEFFRQGDWEKELCLSPSPLCDRNTNLHSQSQLGFIDYIVSPIFDVCGDMLELLSAHTAADSEASNGVLEYSRPWLSHLAHNKEKWNAKCAENGSAWYKCLSPAKESSKRRVRTDNIKQQTLQVPSFGGTTPNGVHI